MSFGETVRSEATLHFCPSADILRIVIPYDEVDHELSSRNAPVTSGLPSVQAHIENLFTSGGFTFSRPALAVYVQYESLPLFILFAFELTCHQ